MLPLPAQGTSAAKTAAAKAILERDSASATAVYFAAEALLGQAFRVYEPETLRLLLTKKHALGGIPELHWEKLLCMCTATQQATFLWEVNAYENTAACCAGVPMLVDVVQEMRVIELAWAVTEMLPFLRLWHSEIQADHTGEDLFDHEPRDYTALMLYKEGFVLAPEPLSWAQESLDALTRDSDLKTSVSSRWRLLVAESTEEDLRALELSDSAEDVQLARLVGCYTHVRERQRQYALELAELT